MAQHMPTSEMTTVACHTVLMKKVDPINTAKRIKPAVQILRSMKGTVVSLDIGA